MTHGLMRDPIDDDRRHGALEEAHFAAMDREYEERQRREAALDEAYAAGRDDEREESGAAQAFLETLLDIWDDGQKNDPESRCYANGALRDEFEAARKFLVEGRKPAPESHFAADAQATAETTTEADARLMAAAPKLLSVAQRFEDWLSAIERVDIARGHRDHHSQGLLDLRAAIAEATGAEL